MKKVLLAILFVIGLSIIFMASRNKNGFNPKYAFGIIESQAQRRTCITYYDDNGNVVNTQEIPYSDACMPGYDPVKRQGDHVYLAPADGNWEGKNDVIDICLSSGEINIYKDLPDELDLSKYISVDSKRIYVNSNLNRASYLYSMSLDGKGECYVKEEEECFAEMVSDNENLYVFNGNGDEAERMLYIYRCEDLKKIKEVHLGKDYGTSPIVVDECVFFTSDDITNEDHIYLGKYDTNTGEETYIDLGEMHTGNEGYMNSNLLCRGNKLYFVSSAEGFNSRLFIYDLTTGQTQCQTLDESDIFQLEQKDGEIYALSFDSVNEEGYLYKYKVTEKGVRLAEEQDVYSKKGSRSHYYYVAGFFVR